MTRCRPTLGVALLVLLGACGARSVPPATSVEATVSTSPSSVETTLPVAPPSTTSATTVVSTTAPTTVFVATTAALGTSSTSAPEPGTVLALDLLATIVVSNEHSGGYQRSLFPHWADLDRNGCSAREDVLIDESISRAQVDPYGCKVIEGDWVSAYDGEETTVPSELDVDHVVALKEAWDSGAWRWSAAARKAYANDLTDERTLRAVSAASNRSKSDKDPSNWLPPLSSDLCRYLGDWVSIKARWSLTMDQSEFGRIRNLLSSDCPGLRIAAPEAPPVSVPTASSQDGETVDTSVADSGSGGDVYYANCAAARAAGAAPLFRGDPGYRTGLDRDKDGVACEG